MEVVVYQYDKPFGYGCWMTSITTMNHIFIFLGYSEFPRWLPWQPPGKFRVPQKYKNVVHGCDTSHPTTISKKFIILIYHYLHAVWFWYHSCWCCSRRCRSWWRRLRCRGSSVVVGGGAIHAGAVAAGGVRAGGVRAGAVRVGAGGVGGGGVGAGAVRAGGAVRFCCHYGLSIV